MYGRSPGRRHVECRFLIPARPLAPTKYTSKYNSKNTSAKRALIENLAVTSRTNAVSKLKAAFVVLASDVGAAQSAVTELNNQFTRRSFVRTHFAFIEGVTHQLASVTIVSATLDTGIFSTDELAKLQAKQGHHQGFKERIKTVLRWYARPHGASFNPQFGEDWDALCRAIQIRDRLMHPKGASDLDVSDRDLLDVAIGSDWFHETVTALLKACDEADAWDSYSSSTLTA